MVKYLMHKFLLFTTLFSSCNFQTLLKVNLEGKILKGPMCPGPTSPEKPCPNVPAVGKFRILNKENKEILKFETDKNGNFKIKILPGIYLIAPDQSEVGNYLWGSKIEIKVENKKSNKVEIVFDTGMR